MNYENTLIYQICCKDVSITDVYIGQTTNFKQRKAQHKSSCNNEKTKNYNFYVYKFIRENGGWDNWDMILVEKLCCNDKLEALQKERYYVEIFKASLNSNVPSRTIQEYREKHQAKIIQYREQNQAKLREYKKKYREENQDKIRQYYVQNQDKMKEYQKNYYERNKKYINLIENNLGI